MSQSPAETSPIGARRVRTDLKTSQNVFLATTVKSQRSRSHTRRTSPTTIKQPQWPSYGQQQQNLRYNTYPNGIKAPTAAATITTTTTIMATHANRATQTYRRNYSSAVSTASTWSRCKQLSAVSSNQHAEAYTLSSSAPQAQSTYLSSQLPARATRLLNRSRLQPHTQSPELACALSSSAAAVDSDSSRSMQSLRRSAASSRNSLASNTAAKGTLPRSLQHQTLRHNHHHHHHQQQLQQHRDSHSSSDDLMLYDKSFRNAMIQDVLQFKKQLLRLRRILQEDEDCLTRTETLNPFENDNGQLFATCGLDSKLLDEMDLASLTSSTTDDPLQELTDLRRQVVYLQSQVDDRERTIRLQRNLIEQLEAEKLTKPVSRIESAKECINMATQTERTRPLAIGSEGLSRSKPEYTSYTTHFPAVCSDSTTIIQQHQQYPGNQRAALTAALAANQTRRHTIISTTLTNYNQHQQQMAAAAPRRASIAWEQQTPTSAAAAAAAAAAAQSSATYKPVKITLIGEPLPKTNGHVNAKATATTRPTTNKTAAMAAAAASTAAGLLLNGGTHKQRENVARLTNGVKNNYSQYELPQQQQHKEEQHQQQQEQKQKQKQKCPQTFYQTTTGTTHTNNGNLKPTVTIV